MAGMTIMRRRGTSKLLMVVVFFRLVAIICGTCGLANTNAEIHNAIIENSRSICRASTRFLIKTISELNRRLIAEYNQMLCASEDQAPRVVPEVERWKNA